MSASVAPSNRKRKCSKEFGESCGDEAKRQAVNGPSHESIGVEEITTLPDGVLIEILG